MTSNMPGYQYSPNQLFFNVHPTVILRGWTRDADKYENNKKMMMPPKISIIIPIYNAEMFLQACLDSANQQTLKDIEIICVDDCSTDSSPDILLRFSDNDKRIRVIKHDTNKGEGAARNTGLDNARGEYVFHLDADDTIPLNALELLYTEAHSHGSDMVKGGYVMIYEGDKVDNQIYSAPKSKIVNTNIHKSKFLQNIPTSHCTYLYKRQFLDQHNIRYRTDLVVGLDLVALTTALVHASTVTLIPDVAYHYYQSKTSVLRGKLSVTIAKDAIRAKKITADMLNAKGLHEAATSRLKFWDFIIATYWQRMPFSLTPEECSQIFSDFRALITDNNVVPWRTNTPPNYRYVLALILANQDEEALSFLRTKDAIEGFSDQDSLKKSLEFVLTQIPDDIEALMELGRIEKSEGNLEKALDVFEKITRYDTGHLGAQLQIAATLGQLVHYKKAHDKLDTVLENLIKGLESYDQIKRVITAKDNLALTEKKNMKRELNAVRKQLKTVRWELHAVYASASWRITDPLRRAKAILKRQT